MTSNNILCLKKRFMRNPLRDLHNNDLSPKKAQENTYSLLPML